MDFFLDLGLTTCADTLSDFRLHLFSRSESIQLVDVIEMVMLRSDKYFHY